MTEQTPFQAGAYYRIKRGYSEMNHAFRKGEVVIFITHAYSPKEGLTRYWFRSVLSDETNAWHYSDGDPDDEWKYIFERISEDTEK